MGINRVAKLEKLGRRYFHNRSILPVNKWLSLQRFAVAVAVDDADVVDEADVVANVQPTILCNTASSIKSASAV